MGSNLRTLRYEGHCARCGATVPAGARGYHDRTTRKVHCHGCGSGARPAGPGASAGREYERRRSAREARIRSRVPIAGALVARLTEPQHQRAWADGQRGEEQAAAALAKRLRGSGVVLLHDRRRPGSRSANLDHIAIGPGGITVIDAKRLKGPVRVERRGLLHPRVELRVAGRDRTRLVAGVEDQMRAVAEVVPEGIDVRGALLFVDGDLPLLGLPDIRAVTLGWPRKVARLAARAGDLKPGDVERLRLLLERALPAA